MRARILLFLIFVAFGCRNLSAASPQMFDRFLSSMLEGRSSFFNNDEGAPLQEAKYVDAVKIAKSTPRSAEVTYSVVAIRTGRGKITQLPRPQSEIWKYEWSEEKEKFVLSALPHPLPYLWMNGMDGKARKIENLSR